MENNIIQLEVDTLLMKKMSFIGTVQKVFGVLAIIAGALMCLGIVTAIVGIPYLMSGIKLFNSGSAFTYASYTNDSKFMKEAILNLASFWMCTLVMFLITIGFYILLLIVFFALLGSRSYYY